MLAKWFLTSSDFDSEEAASSPAIAASALLPEQFSESVDILKYILESWYMYGLQVPEIQRDLLLLNCPGNALSGWDLYWNVCALRVIVSTATTCGSTTRMRFSRRWRT